MALELIETERLIIRRYMPNDIEARHVLGQEAFSSTWSLDQSRRWLEWTMLSYEQLAMLHQPPYGDYAVVLKAGGPPIGSVGLVQTVVPWAVLPGRRSPVESEHHLVTPEFGLYWATRAAHQGKGYATEAAAAFVRFLFEQLDARRVVATTEHDNHASQRVMHKLGMTIERNPGGDPFWFEVVGVLDNPAIAR